MDLHVIASASDMLTITCNYENPKSPCLNIKK